jgi:hypothetical protein
MLAGMTDLDSPQLMVRVYPKDRTGRFAELKRRRKDVLFPEARWIEAWLTPTEEDNQLLTNTLRHVSAGINVASTISLELLMFDKPVLNVAYDPPGQTVRVPYARYYDFDHYQTVVASDAVEVANTPNAMRELLRAALENPARRRDQRRAFIDRMFGDTLDGCSHKRVAKVLLDLASSMVSR